MAVKCPVFKVQDSLRGDTRYPSGLQRGIGLLLVLIVLALLSALAAGLLAAVTVDLRIGDAFLTEAQLVYLAEAGIEDGREALRRMPAVPPPGPFLQDRSFRDTTGREVGRYSVTLAQTQPVLLRSVASIGNARRTVEARIRRAGFPWLSQAVTLDENIPLSLGTDPRLESTGGLEGLVQDLLRNASDVYRPAWGEAAVLNGIGSPDDYRAVVVDGDCEFGSGAGYGILLVRGDLIVRGTFTWNGFVLVVGQGVMRAVDVDSGVITGAVFLARTRDTDRSSTKPLGTVLELRGLVTLDLPPEAIVIGHSEPEMARANERFPYILTTVREYWSLAQVLSGRSTRSSCAKEFSLDVGSGKPPSNSEGFSVSLGFFGRRGPRRGISRGSYR